MRPRLRPRVLPLLVSLLLPAVLLVPGTAAAQEPPPVEQRYKPGKLGPPLTFETTDYFFHGQPTDAVTKVVVDPTFDQTPPSDSVPATQTFTSFASDDVGRNPLAVYWRGPFTGTIDQGIALRWWWSTANPATVLVPADVVVTVFADGTTEEDIIGRGTVEVRTGLTPVFSEGVVEDVSGTVESELIIQAVPMFFDTGHGPVVHYDATQTPSGFGVITSTRGGGIRPSRPIPGPFASLGTSFNYLGREAAEPTVGVTTDAIAFETAGTFDTLPDGLPSTARTEVMRSTDGGQTWENVQPRIPVGWQDDDEIDGDEHQGYTTLPPFTLDPYVYVDTDTNRVFNPELYVGCTWMNFSDDNGETWVSNPIACGNPVNDHQTVVAAPPPPGLRTVGYPNVLYYCFNRVTDSSCGRSLDGGITWSPTGTPSYLGVDEETGELRGGLHGHIVSDREGRLFVPSAGTFGGPPRVAISEDGGTTWRRVTIAERPESPWHEVTMAVDTRNNLYAIWFADHGTLQLPWLSTSRDHGATWSEPLMVAPPGVAQVNFPTIDAGSPGRIAITFPGTTVDDPDNEIRPWDSYVVVSYNALSKSPVFQSKIANPPGDPIHRGDCRMRCSGMFDFLDIVVSPQGHFWATAVDTCIETAGDPCFQEETPPTPAEVVEELLEETISKEMRETLGEEVLEQFRNVATDMEGVSIRQLGGRSLLAPGEILPP